MQFKSNSGFTLIELLVVITLIGIIASFAVLMTGNSRKDARDSRRATELDRVYKVFETCYSADGSYPDGTIPGEGGDFWTHNTGYCKGLNSCSTCWNKFLKAAENCLTKGQFRDPLNQDPNSYNYMYFGTGCSTYNGMVVNPKCLGHYAIMAILETPQEDNESTDGCFNDPNHYTFWRVFGL